MTLRYTKPIARVHRREIPVVDGAGRVLSEGVAVRTRRYLSERRSRPVLHGIVIHLFNFGDMASPEVEWQCHETGTIITSRSHFTGGCWKFETLQVLPATPLR